jgi:hypothetical protein
LHKRIGKANINKVINQFKTAKALYDSKGKPLVRGEPTLIELVCYKISKETKEKFLKDKYYRTFFEEAISYLKQEVNPSYSEALEQLINQA